MGAIYNDDDGASGVSQRETLGQGGVAAGDEYSSLCAQVPELRARYEAARKAGLSLDLTRGKPSPAQLALSEPLLSLPGAGHAVSKSGVDIRNYGGPDGLLEVREIFAEIFGIPVEQFLALTNGSLRLMHDTLLFAYVFGVPGSPRPWGAEPAVRFICPVPGYDRHFGICENLGVEMLPVDMLPGGPDIARIRELVADPAVKGMWLVPTHSNPTGYTTTRETAEALVSMETAAPDFRIFWDDAYGLHHLEATGPAPLPILAMAEAAGNPDRPLFFTSTSKITFAGSGVGFIGASPANLAWVRQHMGVQSISPDKTNHLRHALFLQSPAGVATQMAKHREILAPKFAAVQRILTGRLGAWPQLASWTDPTGGYFVSLNVLPGTAARVVELAAAAGVALTPAGATYPYGVDPSDSNIRLAPSMPPLFEVEAAMEVVADCVLLAAAEKVCLQ